MMSARRVDLEVQAASSRRTRGFTAIAVVLDECAFLASGGESANPDTELLQALRPSLATTQGPMLLTSSPAAMEGIVFKLHKRHYGPLGDPRTLVVQSDSRTLNPKLSEAVVARAFDDDPEAADAEYGGNWRQPTSVLLERPIVERAATGTDVPTGRLPGVQYYGFIDVAGGTGKDSYTMAIGHRQHHEGRELAVVDLVFEQRPPFDPDEVTARASALLAEWGIHWVTGDRYAAAWPISSFGRCGIGYQHAILDASWLYLHVLPAFVAGRVVLPAGEPRLVDQLCRLRRIVGAGGRETVQHPRGGHDDVANAVAGLLWLLTPAQRVAPIVAPIICQGPAATAPHLTSGGAVGPFAELGGFTAKVSVDHPGSPGD
jgi:hypothetical protein